MAPVPIALHGPADEAAAIALVCDSPHSNAYERLGLPVGKPLADVVLGDRRGHQRPA